MVRSTLLALVVAVAVPVSADLLELQKRGSLRVLGVDGSPQFLGLKADAPAGLDGEILEGFARLQHVRVERVPIGAWDGLLTALVDGKGDLAAGGVTVTDARRRLVDFSVEVFPSRQVVVTRKPHRVIDSVEALRGERVGTIKGTSMAEALLAARVPAANVDDSIPTGGLAPALRAGRITACVRGVEDAILDQRADPELQIGTFLGPAQALAFAVPKDSPQLRQALDEYLGNLRKTQTWSRLVVKYFGESALEILKRAQTP
jgi:ABC-type amino acid transport substrate-binding protein